MSITYSGECHCGALGYAYTTSVEPSAWRVRSCQCSFCRRHGAVCTSDRSGTLRFAHRKPDRLARYCFALETADFLVCRTCGVYVGAVIATQRGRFGIVNLNALAEAPPDLPPAVPVRYDDEVKSDRVDRRERVWTPVAGKA
jgi:hypothetical protein